MDDSSLQQFKLIFSKFAKPEELLHSSKIDENDSSLVVSNSESNVVNNDNDDDDDINENKISKKKKKLMSRLSVAELKQLVARPDVVEAHDVTSSDPRLLVYLKAYRNTVPVPRHWCHKRKYLQGKRGVEKAPFQLPDFIAETGISKIRDTLLESEDKKRGKSKAREKIQPKTGKIDIDYQVLHDAFFKFQTKPKFTNHGEIYYEGKENEVQIKEKKPGCFSADLKEALGFEDGQPPPWLINMQRYGPPPSYPLMRLPGLNAPIPAGSSFGYQPGQWGKPPVDEYGQPLYGDVFGSLVDTTNDIVEVDKVSRWGEVTVLEVESEEEDDDDEEDFEGGKYGDGDDMSGIETPSTIDGMSTVNSGIETPDTIDLRKRQGGEETPDVYNSGPPQELYHVIQEKKNSVAGGNQLFGSDRTYALPGKGDVELSMNPEDIESQLRDKDNIKDVYDNSISDTHENEGEDSTNGKRKKRVDSDAASKRFKDFKF
jgi:splicing factor 3B subunit 2